MAQLVLKHQNCKTSLSFIVLRMYKFGSIAKVTSSSITHFGKLFQQACHRQGERMPEVWTYLVIVSTVVLHALQVYK